MFCRLNRYNFLKFQVNCMETAVGEGERNVSIELFSPEEETPAEIYFSLGLIYKVMSCGSCLCSFTLQGEFELTRVEDATPEALKQEGMEQLYELLDEKIEDMNRILHCSIAKPTLSQVIGEKGKKRCACCGSVIDAYVPLDRYYEAEGEKYHVSDSFRSEMVNAQQYSCPVCWSADRERAYALCMEKELAKDSAFRVLDIAPSPALGQFIRRTFPQAKYETADLFMSGVDYKMDIMHMDLIEDNSIDFFICSHVLEHVESDVAAMKELRRILSPRGKGILVVPVNLNAERIEEDPGCVDEGERWRRFGQGDHIRSYSRRAFLERLYQTGFRVKECDREYFGHEAMKKNGLLDTSCVYLVSKDSL